MLDGWILTMLKISKSPELETIQKEMIIIITIKRINVNTHRIHRTLCGILFYLKSILLLSLIL